ncbi:MAG: glycosyltransferase family 39 protein [Rhodospirillum sp.]|nr:glycosyltransferase family 39 protein [Rhodospirillum sp.]MCF8487723.1 glycosyltransferase family 39 protein [Rhodospirillum sp.]MCF8500399.1 glycosyltransferase family 39 protein [Rhodospirillum sp.]
MKAPAVLSGPKVAGFVTVLNRFARPWGAVLDDPRILVTAVLALLAAHAALHGFVFTGLPRDELESVYWGQGWALGYDVQQPPLHNWIALALMDVFGASPALFGLLRVATIGGLMLFLGLTARDMAGERPLAAILTVLGALTTVLLGLQIFLNLTHSLLLLAVVAFNLWSLSRLARTEPGVGLGAYLMVGFALGLGGLSKYSFALFALGLLAGVLAHPVLRTRFWDKRTLLALGLAVLIVLPHGLWMLLADHGGTGGIAGQMSEILKARSLPWTDRLGDILRTAWADPLAGVITPLVLVALAAPRVFVLRPFREEGSDPTRFWRRFLLVYLIVSLTLATLITLALGGSELRDHYLMPAALALPLWLGLRVSATAPDDKARARIGFALGSVALVLGIGLILALSLVRPMTCGRCLTDLPVTAWANALRGAGFESGTLIANDLDGGANLLSHFPGSTLLVPDLPPAPGGEAGTGTWAVVLDPRAPDQATDAVKAWVTGQGRTWPDDVPEVVAPVRGPFTDQRRSLSLVLIPPAP